MLWGKHNKTGKHKKYSLFQAQAMTCQKEQVTSAADSTFIKALEIPWQNKVQNEEIMIVFKRWWGNTVEGISDTLVHTVTTPCSSIRSINI